jgi:hypothetical protein
MQEIINGNLSIGDGLDKLLKRSHVPLKSCTLYHTPGMRGSCIKAKSGSGIIIQSTARDRSGVKIIWRVRESSGGKSEGG